MNNELENDATKIMETGFLLEEKAKVTIIWEEFYPQKREHVFLSVKDRIRWKGLTLRQERLQ